VILSLGGGRERCCGAGKIVTVHVEDIYFRVTCDGTEISLHPRTERRPVTRWKAKICTPKTERLSGEPGRGPQRS
jgi:hypothetical protein